MNNRIKELRKQCGLGVHSIAEFLNQDEDFVRRLEKGKVGLTPKQTDELAALFGVPASAFAEGDTNEARPYPFRDKPVSISWMKLACEANLKILNNGKIHELMQNECFWDR